MAQLLLLLSIFSSVSLSKYVSEDCERVRRPVEKLDHTELMLYVEGMQKIRANGKYQVMIDAHHENTAIHRGSSFFFYHTYYVWEVETQIRNLGGKFKCFSVPYYDWTIDAGHEDDPWILNSVFGGDGNPENHHCVKGTSGATGSKNWGTDLWPLNELCNAVENQDACCLKRNLYSDSKLGTAAETREIIERDQFSTFEGGSAFFHQKVHWLFGLGDECVSCAMATGYSPDDPIFMLLHSYTAYLRAVWAACHGYDKLLGRDLDGRDEAYKPECAEGFFDGECGVVELDDIYQFGEMPHYSWSITSLMSVTPRSMWNFADWNVVYDLGDFPDRAGLYDSSVCDADSIRNSKWLTQVVDDVSQSAPSSADGAGMSNAGPQPPAGSSSADKKPDPKDPKSGGARRRKQHKEAELLVDLSLEERAIRESYDNQAIIVCVLVFLCGVGLFVYAKQKRTEIKAQNPRSFGSLVFHSPYGSV